VLSIFAGDFAQGEIAGEQVTQGMWLLIAAITLTPIIMVVLSLVLPYPSGSLGLHCGNSSLGHLQSDRLALRWGFDNFLIAVSIVSCALVVWYAWMWPASA
jgi:hypothetical protein